MRKIVSKLAFHHSARVSNRNTELYGADRSSGTIVRALSNHKAVTAKPVSQNVKFNTAGVRRQQNCPVLVSVVCIADICHTFQRYRS